MFWGLKFSNTHSYQDACSILQTPHRGTGYRSYLNRAGPQALGSKEVPEVNM